MFVASLRASLSAAALLAAGLSQAAPPQALPPELPAETLGESSLAGKSAARVYVAERQLSEKFVDADQDPWFHHAEQLGDRYWFVSFQGQLTELNLGGPVARKVGQLSLVSARDKKAGWRPGGYQNFAVDPRGQRMVLAMQSKGAEGSHKGPACVTTAVARPAWQAWTKVTARTTRPCC